MYVISQYRRQINQFICADTPRAFLVAWLLLAAALAGLGGVFIFMGAPAMNGRAWDTALFLEGAWRIAAGQVPHRDFYSYLGVFPFYMTWLGMKLSRPSVSAITYGNVIVMVGLGLAAMAVLRRRTSALCAVAMSLFLALLAVTPRPLGDPYDYMDYAMLYNRYGEAFIGLLGVILFLRPAPGWERGLGGWLETAFAGGLMTILLFCKVNYFLMGAGFFVVACLLGRFTLSQALLCLLSAAVVFSLISLATHIPAAAIRQDYQIVAAAPDRWTRVRALAVQGMENVCYLPVLALLVWEMAVKPGQRSPSLAALWRPLVLMASIFGGALLLLTTNTQLTEMPLLALAGLCGAEVIRRNTSGAQDDSFLVTTRNVGALALFALLLFPTFTADYKTVLFSARNAWASKWVSTETLQSTPLRDFRFVKNGTRSAEMLGYMETLDEAIHLLRRHSDPRMRLTAWIFSNPYHFALGWTPAEGGMVGLSDSSVTERSHPPMKRMLGNATHILVDTVGGARMSEVYGPEWDALHLEVVEQAGQFTLFKVPENMRQKP